MVPIDSYARYVKAQASILTTTPEPGKVPGVMLVLEEDTPANNVPDKVPDEMLPGMLFRGWPDMIGFIKVLMRNGTNAWGPMPRGDKT